MRIGKYEIIHEYDNCMNHVALVIDTVIGIKRIMKYCLVTDENYNIRKYALEKEANILKQAVNAAMPCLIEVLELAKNDTDTTDAGSTEVNLERFDTTDAGNTEVNLERFDGEDACVRQEPAIDISEIDGFLAGFFGIVMEYFDGISLEEWLEHYGKPETVLIEQWAMEIATFLRSLHTAVPQMIYGDLKPDNLIVMPDMSLRMLDFGTSATGCCQTDPYCFGTYGYAPKEQMIGRKQEASADIYAFGAVMLRMISGKKPEQPPYGFCIDDSLKYIDRNMQKIIRKAMDEKPGMRYQNGRELVEALQSKQRFHLKIILFELLKFLLWVIMGISGLIGMLGLMMYHNSSYMVFLVIASLVALLNRAINSKNNSVHNRTVIKYEYNLVLTEKKRIGLWMIMIVFFGVTAFIPYQKPRLPIQVYREDGRKLLIQSGTIYETDEILRFEVPSDTYGVAIQLNRQEIPVSDCYLYYPQEPDGDILRFTGYRNGTMSLAEQQFRIKGK